MSFRAVAQHVRAAIRLKKGANSPTKKQIPVFDQANGEGGALQARGQQEPQQSHLSKGIAMGMVSHMLSPRSQKAAVEHYVKLRRLEEDREAEKAKEQVIQQQQE